MKVTLDSPDVTATEMQIDALAFAMSQLLDDMGKDGLSVCLFAKAQARIAYEPFRDPGDDGLMSLDEAKRIVDGADMKDSGARALKGADPLDDAEIEAFKNLDDERLRRIAEAGLEWQDSVDPILRAGTSGELPCPRCQATMRWSREGGRWSMRCDVCEWEACGCFKSMETQ